MVHDHVYYKRHVFVIFIFFISWQEPPYMYIQCGFFPSAVWRLSNITFSTFTCKNIALNRTKNNFLHSLVVDIGLLAGIWQVGKAVCMSIRISVHL